MPHYADGTLAKVGDKVKGKTYNQPEEIVGEIIKVMTDAAHDFELDREPTCMVAYVKPVEVPETIASYLHMPLACLGESRVLMLIGSYDYAETKHLQKV